MCLPAHNRHAFLPPVSLNSPSRLLDIRRPRILVRLLQLDVSSISQRTMAEEHYRKLTLFICSFACYFARHNGFIFRNRYTLFYNPLMGRGNYSATSNNMKLVHWPLMGGLLHLVQRGGDRARLQPSQAPHCCTKCNSVPITILLYDGPLLWGFSVSVKSVQGLIIVEGKNC